MKMTIGRKIVLGYLVLLILLLVIALLGYITISSISRLSAVVIDNKDMNMFFVQKEVDHLNWVVGLDKALLNDEKFTGQLDPTKCGFGVWLYSDEIQNTSDSGLRSLVSEIEEHHEHLHESAASINSMIDAGRFSDALDVYQEDTIGALGNVRRLITSIRSRYDEIAVATGGEAAKDMEGNINSSRILILVISILSGIFGIAIAVVVSRQIIKSLKGIIINLRASSGQVASTAVNLSEASNRIAEGANEQAASIEETSATMEETSSMVSQNSGNTAKAMELSGETSSKATDGNKKMEELIESMDALKTSSSEIAKIIKVIDEIAFNTNILALNAAVEAARAGDAGLGFAVVADEVRNLAQKSAEAAKNTAVIIEQNIELSDKGVEMSADVSVDFKEIMQMAEDVNALVSEISTASDEQARGVTQVTDAIGQMEKVVQENAASAEESAASSEEMRRQADELTVLVNELESMVISSRTLEDTKDQSIETSKNAGDGQLVISG